MGCHTWTYKKFSACSQKMKDNFLLDCNKDVKSFFNKNYEQYIKKHNEICDEYIDYYKNNNQQQDIEEWEKYKKQGPELYQKEFESYEPFKKGVTEDNVLEYVKKNREPGAEIRIINNILYLEIGFDDPFRLYGYPKENFTNKDELLKYLSTKNESVGYWDGTLNKWFDGYSDTLVNKIEDYFKKHGEDNLYFEFG